MTSNGRGEFGARLRALREARGYSQPRLSFALYDLGVTYDASFISRVERGEKAPPLAFMRAIGQLLKPTHAELPEYHLAIARAEFDEAEVGLERALANLSEFDDGRRRALADAEAELQELTRDGSRSGSASRGTDARPAPVRRPRRASGGRDRS